MKISELERELQSIREGFGDIDVTLTLSVHKATVNKDHIDLIVGAAGSLGKDIFIDVDVAEQITVDIRNFIY